MTSLVDAESVLAIDIGSLNTRTLLFDVVDGQYHFIASSTAPTTATAPLMILVKVCTMRFCTCRISLAGR